LLVRYWESWLREDKFYKTQIREVISSEGSGETLGLFFYR
jgi:hypothetical protein